MVVKDKQSKQIDDKTAAPHRIIFPQQIRDQYAKLQAAYPATAAAAVRLRQGALEHW